MKKKPFLTSFSALVGCILLCSLFAACNNCNDVPMDPSLFRYLPYQLNQLIPFHDANQNLDTVKVISYDHAWTVEQCINNQNQTFQYESLAVRLETTGADSQVVFLRNTNEGHLNIGYDLESDIAISFDPLTGALEGNANTNFSFQASEVIDGTTYQNVATYLRNPGYDSKFNAVKVAIDEGLVAYQDDAGVWWYR